MANFEVCVKGKGGNIGQDFLALAAEQDITIVDSEKRADFVALCVPSGVAGVALNEGQYNNRVVIDFSGAAKRLRLGQYGLMLNRQEPWHSDFDPQARVFGNPGCIAGATLRGLRQSHLIDSPIENLSVFATGGSSYTHSIEKDEVRLAHRLMTHPHVSEINLGLRGLGRVTSFMPMIVGSFERGLMVGASGMLTNLATEYDYGGADLSLSEVVGTAKLQHRLTLNGGEMEDGYQLKNFSFSLGVVVDNLRFVTQNAVDLMSYIAKNT